MNKKGLFLIAVLLFVFGVARSQEIKKDTTELSYIVEDQDTLWGDPVLLEEIVVSKHKLDDAALKEYLLLQSRVYKTYPYAKVASERLTALNRNMAKLKTKKEKKKYFKIVEDYIENEFTGKLKKLSRKQGQILVTLIHRQTGETTFDLIKDYKSSWKAFWASNTAKLFDIELKETYEPYKDNQDYLIETILVRAFEKGRLIEQKAARPVDYDDLNNYWIERVTQQNKKKQFD